MRNRIVTAVKQRFSIRKLSIGAASVLLGTSLYFMGVSAPVVHAATNGETPASSETSTDSKDPVSVAGQSKYSDVDVNNAIDQYAEKNQDAVNEQEEKKKTGNKVIIRPSDKQPVTVYNTTDRKTQVENIIQKEIYDGITKANQNWGKIQEYKKNHWDKIQQEYKKNHNDKQILNGTESDYFENQGLSIDDEKGSEINKITVTDDKDTTKTKDVDTKAVDGETKDIGEITKIADFDGIDITHTSHMTDKEREAMKVNSDNKVIVDFQPAQYQDQDKEIDKEITVTYDNLNNSYYLENINDETNRIKISRIDRTFSSIKVADNPHRFYGGWRGNKYDNYDPCNGPQLIIYNDPSDGFFFNNIEQVSVKDIYYDDKGHPIKTGDNKTGDKNTAWIFVTSLNSNGGGNIEKVRALGPHNSPVNAEEIAGSTVTDHDGWWYSDNNNNFGTDPDWDNNDENNLFGFVGTVAFQYYPGMTLQYRADDSQWGSHWASTQTQVVSSLYTPVIIYDHIKDGYSRSDDVNMTVHYVMDDGSKASSDSKQTASFTESGIQDSVTGKITWTPAASGIQDNVTGKITWTPATSQTFKDVTTPAITGYTPNKDKIAGSTVKFGDKDIEVTVTYSPDKQHMTITYIDDTTGETLKQDKRDGTSDQDTKYTTGDSIKQYEEKHYKLVSDSTNGKDLIFDHDDKADQAYEVHFIHDTQKVNRKDTVTETINYKFEDGTTAQPTVTQTENFSEDGNKDLVTGKTTWDEATPQTFEDVTTPAITGYTPNKDKVAGSTVKFGDKDIEVTVTYSPDDQLGHINYIDDNTGKTLARDNFSGKTNGHENYTPTNRIQEFENKGYELVSSDYPDGGFNFDDNDRQDQVFNVHLKHGTVTVTTKKPQTPNTPINPDPQSPKYPKDINNTNHDVKRTIDYKYSDGKTAQPTVTDSLHFERTVVIDKVTGDVLSDTWTPSQDFNDIQTPAIQGYKPDRTVVSDTNIGHDHQNIVEHVIYNPDAQHMTITYVDDTTGETLKQDKRDGTSDQDTKYTTGDSIKQYEEKHYKLVSDSTNGKDLIFDHDDKADQAYEVHFIHDTQKVNRKDTVTETIDYKFEDGKTAQPTVTQIENFSEDGTKDLVTGETTWDEATSQTFEDVVTPKMTGYTPDKDKVKGSTVNFGNPDINVTVHYIANDQTAKITYIDDTTETKLDSKDASGKFGQTITFATAPAAEIANYEKQGYVYVSNNFDNQTYQADNKSNSFEVHLKHGKVTVTPNTPQTPNTPINPNDPQSPKYPKDINNTNKDVKRTIDYKYSDGKTAQPTVNDSLHFERTVVIDKVTGDVLSDTWTPSQDFNDVQTPAIQGYKPDRTVVSDTNIGHDHQNIVEHVIYNPDAQHMTITYVDDTTGETLKQDKRDGTSDQDTKYTTGDSIKQYEDQHYKLVSDSTNGKDLIFDHDDKADQAYEVHFIHDTQKVNRKDTVTETINYKFEDGTTAQPTVTQTENFSEDGTKDLVTGETTWDEATSQTFEDVVTPKMTGYTPDKDKVKGSTVNFGNPDINVTVHYIANDQTAKITYIDDTTETKLDSKDASGKFGQTITFATAPAAEIANYEKQGYVYVSNNFDNQTYQADNKSNSFEVHLKHGKVTVTPNTPQTPNTPINPNDPQSPKYPKDINNTNKDVKRTIDYKYSDGKTAQPTVNDSLHFERTVVIDKVTGDVLSDTWTPSQDFNDVQTPAIQGYKPDRTVVSDTNIGHDHQNIVEHVIYNPDAQHMTITYVDDTTGETLKQDKRDGTSDQDTKYTTGDSIKQYEEKHYKLVSDSTNGKDLIFDHDDKADQAYEVHFIHDTQKVNRKDTVTETIDYKFEDGKTAQPTVTQIENFSEDGTKDLVTGETTWDEATSQTFEDVVTPKMTGYTPDKDKVKGSTVNFGNPDINVTVHYIANDQTAKITYIDDTTETKLDSKDASGKFGQTITFATAPAAEIANYEKQGYVYVSNNFDNQTYQADNKSNSFEVHLKHGKVTVTPNTPQTPNTPINPNDPQSPKYPKDINNTNKDVKRTIDYKYSDGKTAQPTVNDSLHFERTVVIDKVTGDVLSDTWTPSQDFNDVQTPAIQGYKPDRTVVSDTNIGHDHQNIVEHVIYNPDAQHMTITYVDDTTGETLKQDKRDGTSDQDTKYTTGDSIKQYEDQHYKLVSDSTNGKDLIFDHDDKADQAYEVHFVHTYEPVETSQTITETVHYIDANGKPVAPDHVAKVVIKVTGTRDKVTDSITWNTPSTGHFDEVISPEVPNMTPDKKLIPGRDVQYGDSDITESVVYTPDNSTSKTPEKPDKPSKEVSKIPEKPDKPSKEVSKIPEKPDKPSKEVSKTPEKPDKPSKEISKTPEKPDKPSKEISKTPEKPDKPSKEVSKIPEKPIDSRTVDNHVSAKSTAKRELPQTGATINTGIWTGLVSVIASLGLLGASKKRKKN